MIRTMTILSALSVGACATSPATSPLELDISEPDRVAGTFERDGVVLAFDFARAGAAHTSEFRRPDGTHLMSSRLEGREQTMIVLGGRLVVRGQVDAPNPALEGDGDAVATLNSLPEAELLEDLHDSLVEQGIDADLYAPDPPAASNIYDGGDGYFYFGPGERKMWFTAIGLQPTFVQLKNRTGRCATVALRTGGIETRMVNAWGYDYTGARYWWGALLTVENLNAWIDWGHQVCGPTTVGVKVSYSW